MRSAVAPAVEDWKGGVARRIERRIRSGCWRKMGVWVFVLKSPRASAVEFRFSFRFSARNNLFLCFLSHFILLPVSRLHIGISGITTLAGDFCVPFTPIVAPAAVKFELVLNSC